MNRVLHWWRIGRNPVERLIEWLPTDSLSFLEQGGPVLWLILLLSLLMWSMITLCYSRIWFAGIQAARIAGQSRLPLITALAQILPMLGLLGTVEGMIDVFYVIASHGTGNIRGMAGGISSALITTMAGLVTSLSGFYFVSDLRHRLQDAACCGEVA
ncbi:MAG: MotA/TolQ/ExbB proton channel family protein [gamma proteobacterium endosymbiont of Lamellibrachia anaximandri]|nr:MotA/TolQ/ExbB proton channel family protein [gamma proteobacterium endosymbiont of Lamellibrachia anaximandri]